MTKYYIRFGYGEGKCIEVVGDKIVSESYTLIGEETLDCNGKVLNVIDEDIENKVVIARDSYGYTYRVDLKNKKFELMS